MRILLVDDDLIFKRNFVAILRERGYTVESVDNGNQAVTQFSSSHFDLVILDIKLPDVNGIEVLKKIREINLKAHVIVITALPCNKLVAELLQRKAVPLFTKPFDMNTVLDAIEGFSRREGN